MKKHLIAAAVATAIAAPAMAQNVTISGILKPGFEQAKRTGQHAQNQIEDQSSRIIISGSEDLGGGLRAAFQIDTRFAMDNNTAAQTAAEIGGGNTWLALIDKTLGEFRVGKHDLHYNEMGTLVDGATTNAGNLEASAAGGILSQVNGAAVAVTSRSANTVKYDSPVMLGGLRFVVGYSTAYAGADGAGGPTSAGKTGGGSATNLVARWTQGPLSLVASSWSANAEDRTNAALFDERASLLGGSITVGATKVGLVYNQSARKVTTTGVKTERNAWGVGIDHNLSTTTILHAQYSQAGSTDSGGVTTADSGADQFTLGGTYLLSKRTSAGIYYTKLDNQSAGTYALFSNSTGAPTAGQSISSLYFGLRHAF